MTNDDKGMYDWKEICQPVRVGNGNEVTAKKIGMLDMVVQNKDGTRMEQRQVLPLPANVQYVPAFWIKLFSLTAVMANYCDIFSKGMKIIVPKDDIKIQFDQVINTKTRFILGARLQPQIIATANLAAQTEIVKTQGTGLQTEPYPIGWVAQLAWGSIGK